MLCRSAPDANSTVLPRRCAVDWQAVARRTNSSGQRRMEGTAYLICTRPQAAGYHAIHRKPYVSSMLSAFLQRALAGFAVVIGVVTLMFFLIRLAPGDQYRDGKAGVGHDPRGLAGHSPAGRSLPPPELPAWHPGRRNPGRSRGPAGYSAFGRERYSVRTPRLLAGTYARHDLHLLGSSSAGLWCSRLRCRFSDGLESHCRSAAAPD